MIKKTIEGKEFYCFDSSEMQARHEFEKTMVSEDSIRKLVLAITEAIAEVEIKKQKAWQVARELVANEHQDLDKTKVELEYNWILGGFSVLSRKE